MPLISFNPRTPRGVRPLEDIQANAYNPFQSTHSSRSATLSETFADTASRVSIHALLAECDSQMFFVTGVPFSFNPRTPRGVRPLSAAQTMCMTTFQSTHSSRSATTERYDYLIYSWFQSTHSSRSATDFTRCQLPVKIVSIHALLAECDFQCLFDVIRAICFNPRTPRGVRPVNHLRGGRG